jgi:hypothetical protein
VECPMVKKGLAMDGTIHRLSRLSALGGKRLRA